MPNARVKNEYWQTIRGICILAIVLIHCGTTTKMPFVSVDGTYYLLIRSVYSFAVATLFFLAGKFTNISEGNATGYFLKRFKRLLIPYLVWSCVYLLFGFVRGARYSVYELIVLLVTGGTAIPFYYTIVLLYLTILTPLIVSFIRSKRTLIFSRCCTVFLVIVGYVAQFYTGEAGWIKLTPVWLGFYVAGLMQGMGELKVRTTPGKAFILCSCAYVVQVIESVLLLNTDRLSSIAYSQWHAGAFLYAAAVINLFLSMEGKREVRIKSLVYIGDNSYGIYLAHCLFLAVIAGIMNRVSIVLPLPILRVAQFSIAVAGSILLMKIIVRLFGEKSKVLLGL